MTVVFAGLFSILIGLVIGVFAVSDAVDVDLDQHEESMTPAQNAGLFVSMVLVYAGSAMAAVGSVWFLLELIWK